MQLHRWPTHCCALSFCIYAYICMHMHVHMHTCSSCMVLFTAAVAASSIHMHACMHACLQTTMHARYDFVQTSCCQQQPHAKCIDQRAPHITPYLHCLLIVVVAAAPRAVEGTGWWHLGRDHAHKANRGPAGTSCWQGTCTASREGSTEAGTAACHG
jgi:hypothetical protein